MCGLGGTARFADADPAPIEPGLLDAMRAQLAHRGPDDAVVLDWRHAALVFTRLSLTAPGNGRQPFSSSDGQVHLIANGEIYNHRELEAGIPGLRLRTGSDCEVLLHLYERHGPAFLDRVRGMYSVVVVDLRRGEVVLGRDRFGIKPLFYATPVGRLVFGSEIKTLFVDPTVTREVDWEVALGSQALTAEPRLDATPPTSWFKGVHVVPAGSTLTFSLREEAAPRRRTIAVPVEDHSDLRTADDFIRRYSELLADSVRACATSDAGIGLFLSGGVDSVAVAALSRDHGIPSFTALTPTTMLSGDAHHAWDYARLNGLAHHQVVFGPHDVPDAEEWANLVRITETPQCGPEQYYKFEMHRYARSVYPGLKGMMLGAAADEYCGGFTDNFSHDGTWDGFLDVIRVMSNSRAEAWTAGPNCLIQADWATRRVDRKALDVYQDFLAWKTRDVKQYNLWHEDRTAAANGVEARVPFLDERLIALTEAIPEHLRPELLWDKHLVRAALREVLPERFRKREKVAFYHGRGYRHTYLAFARMIAANHFRLLEMALASERAREVLDPDAIRDTVEVIVKSPGRYHFQQVLRLINLGLLDDLAAGVSYPSSESPLRAAVELRAQDVAGELPVPQELYSAPLWSATSVLRLAEQATMVEDLHRGTRFLVDDGAIRFELDDAAAPWTRFLTAVDGRRTVHQVEEASRCAAADHGEHIDELITLGILEVVTP